MGAFAELLEEVRPLLREREVVAWAWDPTLPVNHPRSWHAAIVFEQGSVQGSVGDSFGQSGEEALRNLVALVKSQRAPAR